MTQQKKLFEIEPEGSVNKIVKCLDSLPPEKLLAVLFQACFHMQEKIDDIHDECVHVVKTAGEEEVWDEQEYRSKIDNLHAKAKSIWLNAFNGGGSPKHLGNNLFEELNLQV